MATMCGDHKIEVLARMAAELFKSMPEDPDATAMTPLHTRNTFRATMAVDTAFSMLNDIAKRVDKQ